MPKLVFPVLTPLLLVLAGVVFVLQPHPSLQEGGSELVPIPIEEIAERVKNYMEQEVQDNWTLYFTQDGEIHIPYEQLFVEAFNFVWPEYQEMLRDEYRIEIPPEEVQAIRDDVYDAIEESFYRELEQELLEIREG